jgi:hypothetical protein
MFYEAFTYRPSFGGSLEGEENGRSRRKPTLVGTIAIQDRPV